jgi:hypothetical protein
VSGASRSAPSGREDRWGHLVHAAFLLEEARGGPEDAPAERLRRVRATLDSLLEVFPPEVDPVDDFEGYALRRLAQALQRALAEERGPPR